MKRTLSLLLCILLLTGLCVPAMAETAQETAALPEWLELSADDTVLTVRLPLEDAKEQSWRFSISNPSILDLLTCEVVGDEPGETGDSLWAGSFMNASGKAGNVFLQLTLTAADGTHLNTRMLHLFVREDMSIEVVSVDEDCWYHISEDECTLFVSLPANPSTGFSWVYSISDEEALRFVSESFVSDASDSISDGAGGTWLANFEGAGKAGHVVLSLRYCRPWESVQPLETHELTLFVNEFGRLEITAGHPAAPAGFYVCPKDGEDATLLSVYQNADGTCTVDLQLFRLTSQENCKGVWRDGVLTVHATDAAGGEMVWEISRSPVGLTARVVKSAWSLLPEGTEYEFIPAK